MEPKKSDNKQTLEEEGVSSETLETSESSEENASKKGALVLLGVIVILLVYHVVADRFTPYTQQARTYANVVALAPEVKGRIEDIFVQDNQRVEKGDPLLEIDKTQYEIALQKANADLIATERELEVADANIKVAEANLVTSQAEYDRAKKELDRHESLHKKDPGAISIRRIDVSRANFDKAASRIESAKAKLVQTKKARGSTDSDNDRLRAARSAVEIAQLNLDHTTLIAPDDGLITNLAVDAGQLISPSKAIMTFIAIDDVWISSDMTENNLGNIQVGDHAEVIFDIMPGKVFSAKVRSISYGVKTKKKSEPGQLSDVENSKDFLRKAQRFPVIIELNENNPETLRLLKIGGQVDVIVYTEKGNVTNWIGKLFIRVMSLFSYFY
jgi:multidrug resistance efflux pump